MFFYPTEITSFDFHKWPFHCTDIREVVALYDLFLNGIILIVMNQYQSLKLCVQTMPTFLVACFEKLRWQNVHFQWGRCSLKRNILKQHKTTGSQQEKKVLAIFYCSLRGTSDEHQVLTIFYIHYIYIYIFII